MTSMTGMTCLYNFWLTALSHVLTWTRIGSLNGNPQNTDSQFTTHTSLCVYLCTEAHNGLHRCAHIISYTYVHEHVIEHMIRLLEVAVFHDCYYSSWIEFVGHPFSSAKTLLSTADCSMFVADSIFGAFAAAQEEQNTTI